MRILKVTLHNFGPFFGEHSFDVADRGLVFVCGDNRDEPRMNSNGSGKSTLFDAIDWCLFGDVPKGDHVDSVVNEEAGKECWVECRIEDEAAKTVGVVKRGRSPNLLEFELEE